MKLKTDKNLASKAIFGSAILFAIPAILDWTISGVTFGLFDKMIIAGCAFLSLMAAWARFQPLPPAMISNLCWITYFVWLYGRLAMAGHLRPMDWVLCASITMLLGVSFIAALRGANTSRSQSG